MRRASILLLSLLVFAGCATGQTDPATNVTATSATINGHVACPTTDGSVTYFWRWRKDGGAWQRSADFVAPCFGLVNDYSSNYELSGLEPNTRYQFEACSTPAEITFCANANGQLGPEATGGPPEPIDSFTTLSLPPPPDTVIDNLVLGEGHQVVVTFHGIWQGANPDSFECKLDSGEQQFVPCASPQTYDGLLPGVHTFAVRAVEDGRVDPTPATQQFTIPEPPPACISATPATFATQLAAAVDGDTICLADGAYGTFNGTNKAVTIKSDGGATMRYSFGSGDTGFTLDGLEGTGGNINNGATNITIRNSAFNTYAVFNSVSNANILFDGNTHIGIDSPAGAYNARVWAEGGSAPMEVTIQNSLFQGGDSDGVFVGGELSIIGNRFINVCDGSGPNHTDMVQFADPGDPSGGWGGVVRGNYFFGNASCATQGLTSYDSGTVGVLFEDNVVDVRRPWGIELYSDQGSTVRHNTVVYYPDSGCEFTGLTCGYIDINAKTADPPSTGTQVYDNVGVVTTNRASLARNDHNVSGQSVTYVGPLTFWGGYLLAPGSVGENAASDGLDVGIRG